MTIERTNSEILIRLPLSLEISELQDMIDYLKYKELTSKSKANQEDVDKLVKEVNTKMWEKITKERSL